MTGEGEEYTCGYCGGKFTKTTSDEEAAAEHKAVFGFPPVPEDSATLCDGCYREFLAWADKQGITVDGGRGR